MTFNEVQIDDGFSCTINDSTGRLNGQISGRMGCRLIPLECCLSGAVVSLCCGAANSLMKSDI